MQQVLSGPAFEPITATELAMNLRLIVDDTTDYDGPELTLLTRLISAAREAAEDYTQRIFCQRVYQMSVANWSYLCIPHAPIVVDSIQYYADDNSLLTLPDTDYQLYPSFCMTQVVLRSAVRPPVLSDHPLPVRVIYTVGPASASDVPEKVRQAIILLASYWYENREAAVYTTSGGVRELPLAFTAMLNYKHRIDSFA